MKKLFLLLVAVLSIGLCASAQTRTVNGVVIDANTEEPLIGASVTAAGDQKVGVSTDYDGRFSFVVPANVTNLNVSYVGYESQQVAISSNELVVKLTQQASLLDEVIAVAYGQAKRSEYTGSAGVVKAEQLENALVSNVTSALGGYVAGVQTFSTGGPGSMPTVKVRGTGSINADDSPLYVVDGVPYVHGDITSISPSDVESMVVLKDAASTALYGARGANGVILITTKRGQEGKARITVDARWGVNSRAIPAYDMVTDPRQYMEMTYQSLYNTRMHATYKPQSYPAYDDYDNYYPGAPNVRYYNDTPAQANKYINDKIWDYYGGYRTWTMPDGQVAFDMNGKFNPNATMGWSDGRYYYQPDNWTDETLIDGLRQEYSVSVAGGSERMQYYVSGTYLADEGLIKGSHFNRLTTRASVDYQAKDWLKIGTTLAYIYSDQGSPLDQSASGSSGNAFYFINSMAPVYPVYIRNADGSIMWNQLYDNPVYDFGDGKDYGNGKTNVTRMPQGNPVGDLLYNINDYLMDILDARWYAEITPVKGLTLTQNVSYFVDNTRNHTLQNGLYYQFADAGGHVSQSHSRIRTITLQSLANYTLTLNDLHDLYFLLGYESEDYASESLSAMGSNLYQPLVPYINNTIDDKNAFGSYGELAHQSIFGQAKYTYNHRYYVMGSLRRDGSSRFAPDKRWGTFWSLSAGWDMSKELFMDDYRSTVDILKFKASFGQTGNDGVSAYAWQDLYNMSGSDGVFADGELATKGNPDITWEKSNSFNVGVDFSLWKGKLAGTLEYYSRQTDDMLMYLPVAPSLGYNSLPSNVGSMRNSGFEVDLNYQIFDTRDVQWNVFANLTFNKNNVVEIDPSLLNADGEWVRGTYQRQREGHSLYDLYLPQYAGVDAETGYALYWAKGPVVQYDAEGNVMYEEDNVTPVTQGEVYKTSDWTQARLTNSKYVEDLNPDVYGGFGTSVKAYGFDLSVAFSYQLGGQMLDSGYKSLMHSGQGGPSAWHVDMLNASIPDPENPKITDIPMLVTESPADYSNAVSDRFLTSSDYLSLNNITIGYTLPANLVKKLGLGSVRVYGAAENVYTWTSRKGLDPRQGYLESSNHHLSSMRAISGGITVDF